jgi:hypothetical protein
MTTSGDEAWLDGDVGRLVRPYAVTNGRTSPSLKLDLVSMIVATGRPVHGLEPDHLYILQLCQRPVSVAEIAARLRLPAVVTKVLLADLVDCGAARASAPWHAGQSSNRIILERLLDGLQRRL